MKIPKSSLYYLIPINTNKILSELKNEEEQYFLKKNVGGKITSTYHMANNTYIPFLLLSFLPFVYGAYNNNFPKKIISHTNKRELDENYKNNILRCYLYLNMPCATNNTTMEYSSIYGSISRASLSSGFQKP